MRIGRRDIAIIMMLLLSGCTQGGGFMGAGQHRDDKGDDEEIATPPVPVNGSYYMVCNTIKNATDADPEATIGCVVRSDQNKAKIPLSAVSDRWEWTYQISDQERMGIVINVNNMGDNDPDWHAIYSFKGPDATMIPTVIAATRVQSFAVAKGGSTEVKTFDVKASEVMSAGNIGASPTPSNGIINEGSQPVDGRQPSQP